ncbi:hypothetical protein CDD83_858 [Cordyceps sp. RAO-2017]|nr:hypothetical protein CDD83_858 [Cordyceps sp. RAO-2017]
MNQEKLREWLSQVRAPVTTGAQAQPEPESAAGPSKPNMEKCQKGVGEKLKRDRDAIMGKEGNKAATEALVKQSICSLSKPSTSNQPPPSKKAKGAETSESSAEDRLAALPSPDPQAIEACGASLDDILKALSSQELPAWLRDEEAAARELCEYIDVASLYVDTVITSNNEDEAPSLHEPRPGHTAWDQFLRGVQEQFNIGGDRLQEVLSRGVEHLQRALPQVYDYMQQNYPELPNVITEMIRLGYTIVTCVAGNQPASKPMLRARAERPPLCDKFFAALHTRNGGGGGGNANKDSLQQRLRADNFTGLDCAAALATVLKQSGLGEADAKGDKWPPQTPSLFLAARCRLRKRSLLTAIIFFPIKGGTNDDCQRARAIVTPKSRKRPEAGDDTTRGSMPPPAGLPCGSIDKLEFQLELSSGAGDGTYDAILAGFEPGLTALKTGEIRAKDPAAKKLL